VYDIIRVIAMIASHLAMYDLPERTEPRRGDVPFARHVIPPSRRNAPGVQYWKLEHKGVEIEGAAAVIVYSYCQENTTRVVFLL
jgi:hypothetical protein